jgi:uncharacterized protein (TIGR02284 family)
METNQKVNDVLNDLVKINNDRAEGYEKAIKQLSINDNNLKVMFRRYASESRNYANILSAEVISNGGKAVDSTTISGKIYRAWMDVKTAMSSDENQSVLEACEFGEDAAQKAYKQALEGDVNLSAGIRDIISRQRMELKTAHDEVKRERDIHIAHH